MAREKLLAIGCNWWASYPESDSADRFALSVGFTYTNTNSYMVFTGRIPESAYDSIRACRPDDFPTALDIWSSEYANMHTRLGIPYEQKSLSPTEREEERQSFLRDINNYFVVEENGKPVGMGSLFDDNSGIGSLAVDSIYSGKGYGTKLAAYLTRECMRRGNCSPCLYCESRNENAMHIYRKIGYREKSRVSIAVNL